MSFEENVLLELKRTYTQDETVKLLTQQVAALNFKLGEQKSEISELRHELSVARHMREEGELKTKRMWNEEEIIKKYTDQIARQSEEILKLKKDMKQWRDKYFSQIALSQTEKK